MRVPVVVAMKQKYLIVVAIFADGETWHLALQLATDIECRVAVVLNRRVDSGEVKHSRAIDRRWRIDHDA